MQAQLTQKMQNWLDHVNQASAQELSMSAYAKQHNLSIKAFYHARSTLIQKGIIPPKESAQLVPLSAIPSATITPAYKCKVFLSNGVVIDFNDVDIYTLLSSASQL